ncbi:DUF58 domain-containing protein [Candidatus Babeliales bacterium]|nr:DUF58 domain-containing protein [Candidatus Babeliales bacterium]
MKQSEIQARVARLQFMTKRLVSSSLAGDYCSAFKGAGLEFDQLREYQLGDDIRSIDWNSVAKTDRIMVKQFIQERDRTIIIVMDNSSSMLFGSEDPSRIVIAQQVASALAWIGNISKDKIGFLSFSDQIECWIPPGRGASHCHAIIEALCQPCKLGKKTNFTDPFEFLIQLKKRHAVVFMISDWIELNQREKRLLKILKYEYDFVAFRILDQLEKNFLGHGFTFVEDIETGESDLVDMDHFSTFLQERVEEQNSFFRSLKIDTLTFLTGQEWFKQLTSFFHKRMRRLV